MKSDEEFFGETKPQQRKPTGRMRDVRKMLLRVFLTRCIDLSPEHYANKLINIEKIRTCDLINRTLYS